MGKNTIAPLSKWDWKDTALVTAMSAFLYTHSRESTNILSGSKVNPALASGMWSAVSKFSSVNLRLTSRRWSLLLRFSSVNPGLTSGMWLVLLGFSNV